MAVLQVLVSRDRGPIPAWRVEQRTDGVWIYRHGGLVLSRATIEQAGKYLEAHGVDTGRDLEPS